MFTRMALGFLIIIFFFGIVWAVSDVYVIGFHLSTSAAQLVHLYSVAFAALFLFSFLSSRFIFARKVRILYTLFNMLCAVVFYLLPIAVGLCIVLALGNFSAHASKILSTIALCLAAVLGIVGMLQARSIGIKRRTVVLKNAPASWNNRTAVLVSDTHFGLIRTERWSRKIVAKIQSLAPHFVLHAGDFYDGPMIDLEPVTAPWKTLVQQIPVFYTPGNHEQYGDFDAFVTSVRETGATALLNAVSEFDGVQIAGITYRIKSEKKEAVQAITDLQLDPSKPTILINHPPTFHRAAAAAGVDLMVSGHTHQGQFWPINYIIRILYGVYTYGIHHVGAMTAITTRGVGTSGPPCRLFFPAEIVLLRFVTESSENKNGK
jgi:uncharacterized protein